MKLILKEYYYPTGMNRHSFFQTAYSLKMSEEKLMAEKQFDSLPNPLEKYRIPTPRLVPCGYR